MEVVSLPKKNALTNEQELQCMLDEALSALRELSQEAVYLRGRMADNGKNADCVRMRIEKQLGELI